MSAAVSLAPDALVHPAAILFPLLTDTELSPLIESMRLVGFDPGKPILRYQGAILDGRNRLRAAAMAGVEPLFRDLPDDADPYAEAWRQNGARRDLTPGQRAGIHAKITLASARWQTDRDERARRANEARAEKARGNQNAAKGREENSSPSSDGRPFLGEAIADGQRRAPAERSATAAALAREAGVSRPTMERALKLAKEDPEKLEAVIRGEKMERQRKASERDAAVKELHEQGLRTTEIAERLGVPGTSVSTSKMRLGLTLSNAAVKLWTDTENAANALDGASIKLEQITAALDAGTELSATEEEIRRCIKSLSRSAATVTRLRRALQQRLR